MSGQYVSETGHEHYKWTLLDRMSNPQKIHGQCNGVVVMQGNDGNQHRRGKRGRRGEEGEPFCKVAPIPSTLLFAGHSHKVYSLPRFAISPGIWPTAVGSFIRICFPSIDLSSPALVTGGGERGGEASSNSCFWERSLLVLTDTWAGRSTSRGGGGVRASC